MLYLANRRAVVRHLLLVPLMSVSAVILTACEGTTNSDSSSDTVLAPVSLSDATQSDSMQLVAAALQPYEFSLPFADRDSAVVVYFTHKAATTVHKQSVYRTNSNGAESNFRALVPPLSESVTQTYELFVVTDKVEQSLGEISVKPLIRTDENASPGDFALLAMNSILIDLRGELNSVSQRVSHGGLATSLNTVRNIQTISSGIELFQNNVELSHDAVVFNVDVTNSEDPDSTLTGQDYSLVDALYIALSDQLIEDSILLDDSGDVGVLDSVLQNITMPKLVSSSKQVLGEVEGVSLLSTLASIELNRSDSGIYESASELVFATLIPALVSSVITDLADDGKISESSIKHLTDSRIVIETVQAESRLDSVIMKNALEALTTLEQSIVADQ